MKRILTSFGILLALAACTQTTPSTTFSYDVQISPAGASRATDLLATSERIVVSRLQSLGVEKPAVTTDAAARPPRITAVVTDTAIGNGLTVGLTDPFSLRIMKEVSASGADLTIDTKDGKVGFRQTGLTEKDLVWASATTAADGKTASVVTELTDQGKALLKQINTENLGNGIGIFVRGKLMSRKIVSVKDESDRIVIDGAPSPTIAKIFADDVNVGVYVTFKPVTAKAK